MGISENSERIWHNIKSVLIFVGFLALLLYGATACEKQEKKSQDALYESAYEEGYSVGNSDGFKKGYNQAVVDVCDNGAREVADYIWGEESVNSAYNGDGIDVSPY